MKNLFGAKGSSFLEALISMLIVSIIFGPIIYAVQQISTFNKKNNDMYFANEKAKDAIEKIENIINVEGLDFIIEKYNLNTSASELLNMDSRNNDFKYALRIQEISDSIGQNDFIFSDFDIDTTNTNYVIDSTNNIFDNENLEMINNYDVEIFSELELLEIKKDDNFVTKKENIIEINFGDLNSNPKISYQTDKLDKYKFIISNNSNQNIYLDIFTNDKNSSKNMKIEYIGNGKLITNISPKIKFTNNYVLIVNVFNKNKVFLKKLGTIVF